MKRSEINQLIKDATICLATHGWALPARPRWDVTDFGIGDWRHCGLVLVNLAEEKEYCEKLMYSKKNMKTPAHCHHKKKEDIISRWGVLRIKVWSGEPGTKMTDEFELQIDGEKRTVLSGFTIDLQAGSRVTLVPGVYHEFYPVSEECIIGEVSTANDDLFDNYFVNPEIGRYPGIEEDEPPLLHLVSESKS